MAAVPAGAYGGILDENAALKAHTEALEGQLQKLLVSQHEAKLAAMEEAKKAAAVEYESRITELEAKLEAMEIEAVYGGNERAAQAAKINAIFQGWKK